MRVASRDLPDDLFRRLIAGGCAALIFALAIFAASPVAHDSLHSAGSSHADDRCAVVLFAGGVSLPLDIPTLPPPVTLVQGIAPSTAAEVFLVSPRYLRQPERGPPSLG